MRRPLALTPAIAVALLLVTCAGAAPASAVTPGGPAAGERSPAAASTTPTITVVESNIIDSVPTRYAGFSIEPANLCYVVSLGQSDSAFVQLFRNMGPGVFRVGGNTGDVRASWSTTGTASCNWKADVVTPALVDSFFAFAQSVGYQVMWQVPLGNNNPAEDAAEAAYVSGKSGLYSIEIGNEPNDYYQATTKYQAYIDDWNTVYQDYRADGGTAPVTGAAVDTFQSFYLNPFLAQDSTDITALTEHYYEGRATSTRTCGDLISVPGKFRSAIRTDIALANSHSLPFIMNETNTFSGVGVPGISNAFCSALWAADYMLYGAMEGVQGMYFHGTANYAPGNSGGLTQYYTPINEDGTPAPEYYGMLFYHEMTQAGGSQVTTTTANTTNLDAYAVVGSDGQLRVALVNRNGTASTVAVHTGSSYAQANEISLTAPSLSSLTGVTLGGSSVAADGTWTPTSQPVTVNGTSSAVTVPADSAVMLTYSPSG